MGRDDTETDTDTDSSTVPLTFNFAQLVRLVAEAVPDRLALIAGDARMTYGELVSRGDRAARLLAGRGVGVGDPVGVYANNRAEWVEAMLGCLALRAVPVNINYRYVPAELRYLVDDADLAAVVLERRFLPTLVEAVPDVTQVLKAVVVIDDGTTVREEPAGVVHFEDTPGSDDLELPRADYSPDDQWVIYTGGTTGMPKGVVWRHEDLFFAAIARPLPDGTMPARPTDLLAHTGNEPLRFFTVAPLMHGAAQLGTLICLTTAGTSVMWTGRSFDADAVWRLAESERTTSITLVGDAMGRPLADALATNPGRYDLSGLVALANTGAPMTDAVRDDFARLLPSVFVIDSYGASEMGHNGTEAGERRVFRLTDDTAVLDDDLEPVKPGSDVVGRIARRGPIPLRYHKDPAKTAATFRTDARGVRWVVPGDLATVQADGTVRLLGRANMMINTGGEKVFPEEVENALKSHPEVEDVLVVGVPDTRFGERVAALVALRPGAAGDLDSITAHCRRGVAGYKVPKDVFVVDSISRSPAGKPDYRWARSVAARLATASSPGFS